MRFLKLLFKYLISGGIVISVLGFITMHIIVYTQGVSLAGAVSSAKKLSKRPAHVSDCISGDNYENIPLYGYQVRFVDDKEYVVEAVCSSGKDSIEVSAGSLEFGVKKAAGFSGVVFPLGFREQVDGRVVIGLFFSNWMVEVGDKANVAVKHVSDVSEMLPGNEAARASCEGWGYRCCNPLTEVGEGEVVWDSVLNCSGGCYISCLSRPSILIFTSDPKLTDQRNRLVEVSKKEPLVVFSYSAQDIDSDDMNVSIDYGDGDKAVSSNQTDQFSHHYNCNKPVCTYNAKLSVTDDGDLENTRTRISTVTVRVR